MESAILLVRASAKAEGGGSFGSKRLNASIEIVANRRSALATLRRNEFQVVMVDADLAMQYAPGAPLWLDIAVIVAALAGAARFTQWYPEKVRRSFGGGARAA